MPRPPRSPDGPSGQDPGYYAFQRRLETYERIFADGTTTVLLRPDSDLLRYLESPRPRR